MIASASYAFLPPIHYLEPVAHLRSYYCFHQGAIQEIVTLSNGSYTLEAQSQAGQANNTAVAAYIESLATQDPVFNGYDSGYGVQWEVLNAECVVSKE